MCRRSVVLGGSDWVIWRNVCAGVGLAFATRWAIGGRWVSGPAGGYSSGARSRLIRWSPCGGRGREPPIAAGRGDSDNVPPDIFFRDQPLEHASEEFPPASHPAITAIRAWG